MIGLRCVGTLLLSLVSYTVYAQANGADTSAESAETHSGPDAALARKLKSPRATMKTFLDSVNKDDLETAALCLDLSDLAATDEARKNKAEEYAYKLKDTIDRTTRVLFFVISDDANYESEYTLDFRQAILGDALETAKAISIARGDDGLWRFSKTTVAFIDELYETSQSREKVAGLVESRVTKPPQVWLREQFPLSLREKHFLLRDYQWICLGVLIVIGFGTEWIVRHGLRWLTDTWFRFMANGERREAEKAAWRPLGLLTQALVWYGGTKLIDLPPLALTVLFIGLKTFTVIAAVWTAFRLIDLLARFWLRKASETETKFDDLLVVLVSKSLKTIGVCLGFVLFAQLFSLDVWGLMGGLGIGGIAIAFAAKDALGNFFGSITVLLDRPFEIGDWIVTEDIEGTVETVGMRSTRIRTFYNSQVTLPNSRMTTAVVDNMGRRRFRRVKEIIGVEYNTTPEQLDAFCEGIRELIRQHPYTRKDYFHVYFNSYGDSSLNVLLYCFLACPDWGSELREKHRLLADIFRLAEALQIGFAFPTRTIHMHQQESPSVDIHVPSNPENEGRTLAKRIASATCKSSSPGKKTA